MTTPHAHFDILVSGSELARAFQLARRGLSPSARVRLRVWKNPGELAGKNVEHLIVISRLRDLSRQNELPAIKHVAALTKRFLLFMGPDPIPAETIAESLAELGIRSKERLHLAHLHLDDEYSYLKRFLNALLTYGQNGSIMDAWWDQDELVVISPVFQRLRVPLSCLSKLDGVSPHDRLKFDLDPQGDFIHWPSQDIHMSWPQFLQAANPYARLKAHQQSGQFNQNYGQAIRRLRETKDLSQQSIAGLDPRTIRRIELGQTRATANALDKLAKAHGMTMAAYMTAVAEMMPATAQAGMEGRYLGNFRAAARKAS